MDVRLQKILSTAGVASRRSAEKLILEGRVSVNGRAVTELGSRADPDRDDVRVDGRRIRTTAPRRYILLNKPAGYITSRSDPQHRPTVLDLLHEAGIHDYVYPVGRLDYESEGLLLLTSDGDLAARLTHPRHAVPREYDVQVRGVPDRHDLERIERGIVIDGRRTAPAHATIRKIVEKASGHQALLSLVIHEGRNRQVRKMCDAIGHPVVRLRRVRIGPISDARLKPGRFRELTPGELAALRKAAASGPADSPRSARAARSRSPKGDDPPRRG
jgi:pseudouridine synthase